jgi:hypothetical protein
MSPNDKNITHVLLNRVVSDVAVLGRLDGLMFLVTKDSAMVLRVLTHPNHCVATYSGVAGL